MISAYSQLTDAQRITDEAFISSVQQELINPLLKDLKKAVEGFTDMSFDERLLALIELNNHVADNGPTGDCLMVHHSLFGFTAYAGTKLGSVSEAHAGHMTVTHYEPLFTDEGASRTIPVGDVRRSVIWAFLHGYYAPSEDYGHIIRSSPDMSLVESLPLPYRVALVSLYVVENINATKEEAVQAIVGCGELHSHRFIATTNTNMSGIINSWTIHLRDVKPPQKLGEYLASCLRSWSEGMEEKQQHFADKYGFAYVSPLESTERRSSDSRSELAFAYVDRLIASGAKIGRGGDMSWEQVAAELVTKYGDKVRSYTGDGLRDCYRKRNQRRNQR